MSLDPAIAEGLAKIGHQPDDEIDLGDAVGLWLVVTDGGNGYGCDWADWIDPRFVLEDGGVVPVRRHFRL